VELYDIRVNQSQHVLKVVVVDKCIAETVQARKHVSDLAVCFYQLFECTDGIGRDLLTTVSNTLDANACDSP
jgi:hypothetical protein